MPVPQALAGFNIADANVSLWLFRKSGQSDNPIYTGRWVQTDGLLNEALKSSIAERRDEIVETHPYDLLATIDIGQSLTIGADETHVDRIVAAVGAELPERRAQNVGHVQNTDFYVVKLTHNDSVLHAVTKADASWKSRRILNKMTVYFTGDQLGLEANPAFSLSRGVDFFVAGDDIIILDRDHFESILNYKSAHSGDFAALQAEANFINLFDDVGPVVAFVGTNKLHLRRVCAIRAKGHYQDPQFMQRLRQNYANAGLDLTFDAQGRIVASPAQCPDIIRALLDHRLHSLFSQSFYDVQNATAV